MKKYNFEFQNDYFRLFILLLGSLFVGALIFVINNIIGFFSAFIFLIQIFVGVIFGMWYLRLFFAYLLELRGKNPEKKVGITKSWGIFSLVTLAINFLIWTAFSNLIFNFPKIVFLVPVTLAMIQVLHVFRNANRKGGRDWLILFYNFFAFIYLFIWTLNDFGIDFPGILGIIPRTITSTAMWWQIIFLNTGAFFAPTFVFPPIMLNPRYYLAMPIEKYYEIEEKKAQSDYLEKKSGNEEEQIDRKIGTKYLPGERIPFFEERKKEKEMAEEIKMARKERLRNEKDIEYAEFVSTNDVSFSFRKFIAKYESFLKTVTTSIILILIIFTPICFAGTLSFYTMPNYNNVSYSSRPDMVLAISGSVFSSVDRFGNISPSWEKNLQREIDLTKELHATHLRYNLNSLTLNNNNTKPSLDLGLSEITSQGINLILSLTGKISFSKQEYIETIYNDALVIASNYKPDFLIIFNEINSEVMMNVKEFVLFEDWFPAIANISSAVKAISPQTKIVVTVLSTLDGIEIFSNLFNNTLNIDVLGVSFYPLFFSWRYDILSQFSTIFHQKKTTEKFWISETGLESFNYGEEAQARYLSKILYDTHQISLLNVDGICIKSLIDNEGFTIQKGIISHFGLVYFSGKKKIAFFAVQYALENILSI